MTVGTTDRSVEVLLPWAIGLAVWEVRWESQLRVLLNVAIALANLYTFFP